MKAAMKNTGAETRRTLAVLMASALLVCCHLRTATADCSDVDVRCRIATSNMAGTEWSRGCEVGAEGTVDMTGPSATVNGKCFVTEGGSDSAEFVVVGVTTIGACFDLFKWPPGCQPANCPGNTPAQRCNERIPDCTVRGPTSTICTNTYKVVGGDSCWGIANANGQTVEGIQAMNPGLNCDNLQINQDICLSQGQSDPGPGTPKCEGHVL